MSLRLKRLWDGRFKLKMFARDGVVEVQAEGMKGKAADGVAAVAVFCVAAYGMPHVGHVDANLVFATRLQLQANERIVISCAKCLKMGDGQLAVAFFLLTIGDVGRIILEPATDCTALFFHTS